MSKREVPYYIERAILRLSGDYELAKMVHALMPTLAYGVGVYLINADLDRRNQQIQEMQKRERAK